MKLPIGLFTLSSALAPALLLGCTSGDARMPALGTHRARLVLGEVHWEPRDVALPPARMGHALIYDPVRAVTLAVGGRPVDDTGDSLSDTWAWQGSAWSQMSAAFPERGFVPGTFDSNRGVSITYGGINRAPFSSHLAGTHERGTGDWTNRSDAPGGRSSSGLAFDAARGVTVLFGGYGGSYLNDVWEWDGTSWTQRCAVAPCSSAAPSARASMVLTYDAARQQTLLFGGVDGADGGTHLGDTWTWDGSAWTLHATPIAPNPRRGAAAEYDPVTQLVYVFGGADDSTEFDDLWVWDGSVWQEVETSGGPGARRDARLAWDGARRRGVLFGGRSGSQSVDFWEFSLIGNECTTSDRCHTGACDGTVCVEAAPPDAGATGATGAAGAANSSPSVSPSPPDGGPSSERPADAGDLDGETDVVSASARSSPGKRSLYGCSIGSSPGSRPAFVGLAACVGGLWLRRRRRRRAAPRREPWPIRGR